MKLLDRTLSLGPEKLVSRLERLRDEEEYKDVTISIHGVSVAAHKCILATTSSFFKLLFRQAQKKRDLLHRSAFELVGLSAEDAKHIDGVIEFFYTGTIYLNNSNFTSVVKLADYLVCEELLMLCEVYMGETLAKENCLKVYLDLKRAVIGGDMSKSLDKVNEHTRQLLELGWKTVEDNFYDYVIDHHEFFEVIPEEVEKLLSENLQIEKVLKLVVRWMNTWPLGFTFADSLVNLIHKKLDVIAQEEMSEDSRAYIVHAIKNIREQVLSRTVPKSNRANMLTKLHDIREIIEGRIMSNAEEMDDSNNDAEKSEGSVNNASKTVEQVSERENLELVEGTLRAGKDSKKENVDIAVNYREMTPVGGGSDSNSTAMMVPIDRYRHTNDVNPESMGTDTDQVLINNDKNIGKNVVVEMVATELRIPKLHFTGDKIDNDQSGLKLDFNNLPSGDMIQNFENVGNNVNNALNSEQVDKVVPGTLPGEQSFEMNPALQRGFEHQGWHKQRCETLPSSDPSEGLPLDNREIVGEAGAATLYAIPATNAENQLVNQRRNVKEGIHSPENTADLVNNRTEEIIGMKKVNVGEDSADKIDILKKSDNFEQDYGERINRQEGTVEDNNVTVLCEPESKDGLDSETPDASKQMDITANSDTDDMDVDEVTNSIEKAQRNSVKVSDIAKSLQERVLDCLRHQEEIKTEVEDTIECVDTPKQERRKRRKRGRPVKYIQPDDIEGEIDEKNSKESSRGVKRKLKEEYRGETTIAKLDGTIVKVEVGAEGELTEQYYESSRVGDDSRDEKGRFSGRRGMYEENDVEGDSDDDYSESYMAEMLNSSNDQDFAVDGNTQSSSKRRKRSPRKQGNHECTICQKVYSQKYRLAQHMNVHFGIKPHQCVVCQLAFTRTDHVIRHMRTQHQEMTQFDCDDCGETFKTINEVVSHKVSHLECFDDYQDKINTNFTEEEREYISISAPDSKEKPTYTCTKCNQVFKKPYLAREHVNFHTGATPFKCEHCEMAYGKRDQLTTHVRTVHEKLVEFKCSKCKRGFIKKENFDSHFEQCEPKYSCEKCDMKFYRKTHLDNHMPVHDASPQQKCPQCDNTYRYRKHLLRHIKKDHNQEKDEPMECICDACGVVVKSKEALYRHKKTHRLPDKECDVCGKAFKDNTTLKDHKLMHTDTRDYQCEICSMLFRRKGNLVRHQKRHRGERKYRCEVCGMCFVANCDLTRHKNTHLGVKKYPCRYCGRKFGLKSKVVVHERTHTGERPYVCRGDNCGKTFKQTGDRVRHEKKVHNLTINKYMTLYELAQGKTEDIFRQETQGEDGDSQNSGNFPMTSPAVEAQPEASASNQVVLALPNYANSAAMGASGGYSQGTEVDQTYIEEAEMSKIFQRTVEQLTQDAIARSGIQF